MVTVVLMQGSEPDSGCQLDASMDIEFRNVALSEPLNPLQLLPL